MSDNAADVIAEILGQHGVTDPVEVAFVLGTGQGGLADAVENPIIIPYSDLPGFPKVRVSGHEGKLVIGMQEGTRVAYMQGRAHFYETGDPASMAIPLETLALLGVHSLVLICSAGSTRADLYPGNIALISDHINFSGMNPLIGSSADGGFVNLNEAYDPRMTKRMKRAAIGAGVSLSEGIYMWFSGPTFETPSEIKMARLLGADMVGMSIVPEVILGRRLAMRISALALITNFGAGFQHGNPSHTETKENALRGAIALKRLARAFLKTKEEAWGLQSAPGAKA